MMNIQPILLTAAHTSAADEFVKLDPYGIGMSVMAMIVVMLVLAISAITFQNIDNLIHFFTKLIEKRTKKNPEQPTLEKMQASGNEIAAIAMALHLYRNDLHDNESLTLTINKISRTYSPWSSKIYGIMNKAVKRNPYSK
ncbi:MAG: OadG family protein [Tenuifilaceae bacterium]|jgi:Na+-transporting methylmalonyl-CoA/oxaloacetate decarboxylase gamma subunit|nr:OadG family protein [Tenuifilaceae bacterium]